LLSKEIDNAKKKHQKVPSLRWSVCNWSSILFSPGFSNAGRDRAAFDSFPKGFSGIINIDRGITFFDLDERLPGQSPFQFSLESTTATQLGSSAPNYLTTEGFYLGLIRALAALVQLESLRLCNKPPVWNYSASSSVFGKLAFSILGTWSLLKRHQKRAN